MLFVISGPTGSGKTTISNWIADIDDKMELTISHTTRKIRENEDASKDYHFISENKFVSMIDNDEFLEYERVHDSFYGTSKKTLLTIANAGRDALLTIDVKGAVHIKTIFRNAVLIFIFPPKLSVWEERIKIRDDNSDNTMKLRMHTALFELENFDKFDYALVNDKIDESVNTVSSIVDSERHRVKFIYNNLKLFSNELLTEIRRKY